MERSLHTPSIAFRHLPPHSEHRFPAPSSTLRASLSDIFLHTPSIAFRHLPPHSQHRFPAPSSTLPASLSGTFLHAPSIAFRHRPPDSARFGYATEGALFISTQLSTDAVSAFRKVWVLIKLQALVYDILPSTTAVFSYAICPRKLSANGQFFVGAQTVVSLLQTTQIKQGVSFIAANKVYTSTNKTTIV